MKRSMKPLTQLALISLFPLIYVTCGFNGLLILHQGWAQSIWLFSQRRQRCPIFTQQKAKRKGYHRKRTAKTVETKLVSSEKIVQT